MLNLDALRFGLAGGIVSGFLIFVMTIICQIWGTGQQVLTLWIDLFPGYEISMVGSLIGACYGLGIGFFKLYFLAFVYNMLAPLKT
jgi:hypothetical protein